MSAVALGLAAALLVVEFAARRIFGVPLAERTPILVVEANPYRGFSMVPDQEHYTYLHRTRTNSLGLRGPELGPKDPSRPRIFLLGDSMIYGQGVADDDTVGAWLERGLGARGRPAEVVNGGVRAYSTHQELGMLLELGDAVAPDVVVLAWFWNDIDERDLPRTVAQLTESGPVAFDTGAPMRGWTWWKWQLTQIARASAIAMQLHDHCRDSRAQPPSTSDIDAAFERLPGYLDTFLAWCGERGVRFVLFALPEPMLGEVPHHLAAELQARAVAIATEKGIPAADLSPALHRHMETARRLPVLAYDGHFDGEGNRIVGDALAEFLLGLDDLFASATALPE